MTDTVARSLHRILETERLHLREAVDRDEPGFIRYIDDRKVRTLDDARGYIGQLWRLPDPRRELGGLRRNFALVVRVEAGADRRRPVGGVRDRKSTRLNSSH